MSIASWKRRHFVAAALVTVVCGVVIGTLLHPSSVSGQGPVRTAVLNAPLPPPVLGPDIVPLTNVQKLGKFLIYDNTLSDPPGYACATCHIPSTGHTGPSSQVNANAGPQPGVVPGRTGRRKPQTYNYATLSPEGPYFDNVAAAWVGGNFWDGRAPDSAAQALDPLVDPNEMANINQGTSAHPFSPLVVQKIQTRPYSDLFKQEWGPDVFTKYTPQQLYILVGAAMAAFEDSPEVNSFSSKYDASKFGVPPMHKYKLTASEERGRRLFFGNALCSACHSSTGLPVLQAVTNGKDTFTMYCFANIGIPRNPLNPFYQETDCTTNPLGCNALGTNFIDLGLGGNPNPAPNGMKFFHTTLGDIPQFNGLFQAPTVRDVDKRPTPTFVKAYMHNGVFKSLKEVVHFYNTRNLTTSDLPLRGKPSKNPINLTNPTTYAASLGTRKPIWGPPEVLDPTSNLVQTYMGYVTLNNPTGLPPSQGGQVGNLGLTDQQENDIVAFLKILTADFTKPNPIIH
ncbi:MAG: Cytochrome c peroxidase family protein [Planctomycetota bacterium]|nr:Cytochrome c peroxidase family protein [Planctomycetota bacterium]